MSSVKSSHGFLQFLRPFQLRKSCIQRGIFLRRYNPPQNDRSKDILKEWAKSVLHESCPEGASEHSSDKEVQPSTPVDRAIEKKWKEGRISPSFQERSEETSECTMVQIAKESSPSKTSMSTLSKIASSLQESHKFKEIDSLYKTHRTWLSSETVDRSSQAYNDFVQAVFTAEYRLQNFTQCEALFSECLKFRPMSPEVIDMGLVTFVKNNNLTLAKEFYVQVLKNPETFPVTPNTLHAFVLEIFRTSDLATMERVIALWLENSSSPKTYPFHKTFALLHRLLLKLGDEEGVLKLLSHPGVKKTKYEGSTEFDLCLLHHEVAAKNLTKHEEIGHRMDEISSKMSNENRSKVYIEVLKLGVAKNDFSLIKLATVKAQKDSFVRLNDEFHKHVCRYFVKNGLLKSLVQYLNDVVVPKADCHFGQTYVEQLWNCALQNYPMLSREFTNDLQLLLNKEELLREYEWLEYTTLRKLRKFSSNPGLKKSSSQTLLSLRSRLGSEFANAIQSGLADGDAFAVRSLVLNELQRGLRPDFTVLYSLLKLLMQDHIESAKLVDQILRETYREIPLKIDILWLKHNALEATQSIRANASTPAAKQQAALVAATKIKNFEKQHSGRLNFQNYMQLSSLFLVLRDAKKASHLLEKGKKLINSSNKRDWFIYYSNALKVYTRARDSGRLLSVLKDWNGNDSAWLITPDTIRSCKGYMKYFERNHFSATHNSSTLSEIHTEIDSLLTRYVNFKFQGLNDMKLVSSFLQRWIEQDLKKKREHRLSNTQSEA
ncbi:LAQU0S03e03026g1_1 [Lachancea quebecensis]|uniref:LAQU0S03e03026g1_1 n=1 Tax=Lachancea quebecensis TaxID=1654605 RepID=A0A0P1KPB4_9SACH|nr:LAQU0S03e03026g1_1 [Lachancea quebecensis]